MFDVTVVCWVSAHHAPMDRIHAAYAGALAGRTAEFLYVLDGPRLEAEAQLGRIQDSRNPMRLLRMAKGFGEASAHFGRTFRLRLT